MNEIDAIDRRILAELERDGSQSQREIAERVGLSQNACWRRMKRLEESGIVRGIHARLDATALGLDLTVFMMVRTRNHSADWSRRFRAHVASIPEITEFHRIGGEWDYLIKVVTSSMAGYDRVYKCLIEGVELETVTGFFSMETMFEGRPLSLSL